MEDLSDIEGIMKSHKNSLGTSLFDHISNVVNTMKNNPSKTMDDPMRYFEMISHFIQRNQFNYRTPMSEADILNIKKSKSAMD